MAVNVSSGNTSVTGTVTTNIIGGTITPVVMAADQTFVQVSWSDVNDGVTVYTVTAGKTLYITQLSASVVNGNNNKVLINGVIRAYIKPVTSTQSGIIQIGNGAAAIMTASATQAITVGTGGASGNSGTLTGYEV